MDIEETTVCEIEVEHEYDRHKFAKMMLIAAASFLVGKAIELGYDKIREQRAAPDAPTETE